jgi:hypothetical protein
MSTLVDVNVLVDIYEPGSHWAAWSESKSKDALLCGLVVINQVVAAETATEFTSVEKYETALRAAFIRKEEFPGRRHSSRERFIECIGSVVALGSGLCLIFLLAPTRPSKAMSS